MSLNLYDITVPVFIRGLEQLKEFLQTGEKWAKDEGKDEEALLQGKLAPDMLPLAFQIRTSCDGAKGVVARIGGGEAVPIEDNETTFAQFYARIDRTLEILKGAKRDAFNAPDVGIEIKLGPKTYKFNSIDFAQKFATPNFFFHVTTAYAILRNAGVPVGKRDYLGHSLFVEA